MGEEDCSLYVTGGQRKRVIRGVLGSWDPRCGQAAPSHPETVVARGVWQFGLVQLGAVFCAHLMFLSGELCVSKCKNCV